MQYNIQLYVVIGLFLGAVKFGDPLGLEDCDVLLRELRGCSLPFQCAHGRPSIAPLIELPF